MRHGFKKAKFAAGYDADRMLMRKLMVNFFKRGKLSTTFSKIKALKPEVERAVTKIKKGTEADKNTLLKRLGNYDFLSEIFKEVATQLSKVQSGYTKIIKLGDRESDGAKAATLVWAYPVVMPTKKKEVVKKSTAAKADKEVVKKEIKSK
jgi:large subunit ribosomal protein L17